LCELHYFMYLIAYALQLKMSKSENDDMFEKVKKLLREKVNIVHLSSDKKQKVYLFGESEENIQRGRDYKSLAYLAYCVEEVILKISDFDTLIQDMVCEHEHEHEYKDAASAATTLIDKLTSGEGYCIREYELHM
jgi:hypothetical protein